LLVAVGAADGTGLTEFDELLLDMGGGAGTADSTCPAIG
jgi:hypothetical protein